jgi:hypothetical protein
MLKMITIFPDGLPLKSLNPIYEFLKQYNGESSFCQPDETKDCLCVHLDLRSNYENCPICGEDLSLK